MSHKFTVRLINHTTFGVADGYITFVAGTYLEAKDGDRAGYYLCKLPSGEWVYVNADKASVVK